MFVKMARRLPQQERGRRRVDAILHAAAEVFAESGYDGCTMDQIAKRAKSSVGSIYQFYPNKQALFVGVAERCLEQSVQLFSAVPPEALEALEALTWEQLVVMFLDSYYDWEASSPFVRALNKNLHMYGTYEVADQAMTEQISEATAQMLSLYLLPMKPAARRRVAKTVVNTATACFLFARQETRAEAKHLFEETKTMLLRYLHPYMKEPTTDK